MLPQFNSVGNLNFWILFHTINESKLTSMQTFFLESRRILRKTTQYEARNMILNRNKITFYKPAEYIMTPMKKHPAFWWKIYLLFFALYVLLSAYNILDFDSYYYRYYHTLMAFCPSYILNYSLAAAKMIVTALSLIPLLLFAFGIRWLTPQIWRGLLVMRIIFEFLGNTLELAVLKSIFNSDPVSFWLAAFLFVLFLAPSYVAHYSYARDLR